MRLLFNQVRALDGYENIRANKIGMIPTMMDKTGFVDTAEAWTVLTPWSSISLRTAARPEA